MEELLDLYDRHGRPTGVTIPRGSGTPQAPEGMYWRVCDVWLVNRRGELLVQQRAMTKENWPGRWCESAGGAVRAGESAEDGCVRETLEEIGVRPDMNRGGMIFEYLGGHALHQVWLFHQDVPLSDLRLQAEEVADARYVTPVELRAMAAREEFIPLGYLDQFLTMLPVLLHAVGKDDDCDVKDL